MNATLSFKLPEEKDDFTMASHGHRYHAALWEIARWFRDQLKYAEHSDEKAAVLNECREKFYEILEDNHVDLDEVS